MVEGQGRPTFFLNIKTEKIEIEKRRCYILYDDDMKRGMPVKKTDITEMAQGSLYKKSLWNLEQIALINNYAIYPLVKHCQWALAEALSDIQDDLIQKKRHEEWKRDVGLI